MKHLRRINESIDPKEYMNRLKDALTELTDDRTVKFTIHPESKYDCCILTIKIKLESYFSCEFELSNNLKYLSEIEKSNNELLNLLKLVNEGIERSQIDYEESNFRVTYEEYITWDRDEIEDECNIITFNIELKRNK